MLTLTLPDGAELRLSRPPDWDEAVIAARVRESHALGTTILARVQPLKKGFKAPIPSRAHRGGWGFWDRASGAFERWCDRAWSSVVPLKTQRLLVVRYFEHRIQRLALPDFAVEDECTLALPQCGIEELVVSLSERLAIAYLNSGQGENGYELLELAPLGLVAGAPGFTLPVMISPPAFTPDEARVVCVFGRRGKYNRVWWRAADELEDDEATAPGGETPFAEVLVHDLAAARVTRHLLDAHLPRGWSADPDDMRWCIPELAAVGNDHLVLAMPSDRRIRLPLPLPERLVLQDFR